MATPRSPRRQSSMAGSTTASPVSGSNQASPNNPKNMGLIRRKEDSLATVFLPIILVFLFCNFPRIFLDVHELATFAQTLACRKAGLNSFSTWEIVMLNFSHFLLVVNSAANLVIYTIRGSKFREEFYILANSILSKCKINI